MFTFREIYELLKSDEHFGAGMEVEVLKGFYYLIPSYRLDKKGYRKLRLSSYKPTKNNK